MMRYGILVLALSGFAVFGAQSAAAQCAEPKKPVTTSQLPADMTTETTVAGILRQTLPSGS